MKCKLYVTSTGHSQLADNLECRRTKHLVLLIGQGLGWCHNDTVTGMNTNRIQVLHITYGNAISVAVTHYLILDLFPSGNTSLHKNLTHTRKTKTIGKNLLQFFLIMGNASSGTTKGIGRTQNYRITDLFCKSHTIFDILYQLRRSTWLSDPLHQILKLLTSLCITNRFCCCSKKLYIMTVQKSGLRKLHTKVQPRLSTHVRKKTVRFFHLNDVLEYSNRQWLNIYLIRNIFVRHDRCRIGVDKDNLHSLFLQRTACLCSRIVKLGCLSDNDRTGTNYQYTFNSL